MILNSGRRFAPPVITKRDVPSGDIPHFNQVSNLIVKHLLFFVKAYTSALVFVLYEYLSIYQIGRAHV